jgi:hypothetical protein
VDVPRSCPPVGGGSRRHRQDYCRHGCHRARLASVEACAPEAEVEKLRAAATSVEEAAERAKTAVAAIETTARDAA